MAVILTAPNLQLPWSSTIDDDRRFWRITGLLFIPFFLVSVAIPLVEVPELKREELTKLPPQLARLKLEEKVLPTPIPTPVPTPEPTAEPTPEPEAEKVEPKPTPVPPKVEPKKPEPTPKPTLEPAKLIQAKEVAQAQINEFADLLSDIRDTPDLPEVGTQLDSSTGEAAQVDRSIIGNKAKAGSGGIDSSKLSRDTGGVALAGKKSTQVDSKLAEATAKAAASQQQASRDGRPRSEEQMRRVMDRNKGAMDAIYNRALRKDPTLEGKVVFEMIIEPDGRISSAKILSSDFDNPALEAKLLAKIRSINFGAEAVIKTTLRFSFDFLPY
ncbi:AgmX/PglI C-terminal domain-containing protein [Teredinibacter waterburyi]|uniref:AgmX/PglI C-terminal domain-containing protein n=1 Tax=Teredinibacter waterburyi TaxID=1500538 RepID=UPI00165FB9C4|nr:AgmX/PglI C-terminal domain-containing protein [Teredinibacter waterburyi]